MLLQLLQLLLCCSAAAVAAAATATAATAAAAAAADVFFSQPSWELVRLKIGGKSEHYGDRHSGDRGMIHKTNRPSCNARSRTAQARAQHGPLCITGGARASRRRLADNTKFILVFFVTILGSQRVNSLF